MALRHVPNSTSKQIILAGTEASRGAGAVPDHRWPGVVEINKKRPVNRAPEATGTRDRLVTPQHGLPEFSGNYSEPLTFVRLSQLARYWIDAGDPAVADAAAVIAYTRDHVPGDVLDSVALQYGFPGLGWESVGVLFNEGTVTIDFDNAEGVWQFAGPVLPMSKDALPDTFEGVATGVVVGTEDTTLQMTGAGWTVDTYASAWVTIYGGTGYGQQRQIVSNTADAVTVSAPWDTQPAAGTLFRIEGLFEPGIPVATDQVKIQTPGTRVFIDALGLPIGSTQVRGRMISTNLTVTNALAAKWFLENEDGPSDKLDEGDRLITGQVQMEFDRRDEYEQYSNLDEVALRIEKLGPVIDATAGTNYLARLDVARAYWTDYTPGTRQNNITATFAFDAYVPAADPLFNLRTVTPVAALF